MARSDYWCCPVCDGKALYDGDENGVQPDVQVIHDACLERDRAERERAVREQVAREIEAYQPVAHPVVCPPEIAYQAAMERAAAIARGTETTNQTGESK